MKLVLALAAISALASCAALPSAPVPQGETVSKSNRISLYVGRRDLDEDDYDPVDQQYGGGIEFSHERSGSAIGWEIGVMGSGDKSDSGGTQVDGATGEVYAGLKKSFGDGNVRPYVGAGVSYIGAAIDLTGPGDEHDESIAGYAHGGLTIDLTQALYIGADFRALFGSDIELGGADADADYLQLAFVLGFAF